MQTVCVCLFVLYVGCGHCPLNEMCGVAELAGGGTLSTCGNT